MGFHFHRACAVIGACLLALCWTAPAQAEWRRAESPRFIVYSNGSERALRTYVQKLETFESIVRYRLGLDPAAVPVRKFPIYLVPGRRELLQVYPALGRDIVGVYFPTDEDIFAVATRDADDDILLHEYSHHFMFQNDQTQYPGWLVEGFAEYLATAEIDDDSVQIGGFNQNRASWLIQSSWIPLEELLAKRPDEVRRGQNANTYYPVAWLLTHWFMSEPDRRAQLKAYVDAVAAGGDPVQAMQQATGLDLNQLRRALRDYMTDRLTVTRYASDFARVEIAVTTLPRSADALLLIGQRLKIGVPDAQRAATAEEVRRLAAPYPDDPFAMLQLGHAELHFGDPEAGEAVLTRLLEREPENVEALQLMATRRMGLAQDADDAMPDIVAARRYLARAFAVDDANYYTLMLLGRTRQGAPSYPNENDLLTWALAYQAAPQLAGARLGYASALMDSEKFDEATVLLRPLANAPHGGGAAAFAQTLLERAEAGLAPPASGEIDAVLEAEQAAPPETPPTEPAEGELPAE